MVRFAPLCLDDKHASSYKQLQTITKSFKCNSYCCCCWCYCCFLFLGVVVGVPLFGVYVWSCQLFCLKLSFGSWNLACLMCRLGLDNCFVLSSALAAALSQFSVGSCNFACLMYRLGLDIAFSSVAPQGA